MADDPIRAALADLGTATFDTPAGCVRVWRPDVEGRGFDAADVGAWVAAHGGQLDPARNIEPEASLTLNGVSVVERIPESYVVPVAALAT